MKHRGALAGALVTAGLMAGAMGIPLAGTATAAQSTLPIDCGGQTFVVRTNNNNSSDHGGWSSAQLVSEGPGRHLIPVAFSGQAVDTSAEGQPVIFEFSQVKGNGNANHNQETIQCTATQTGTFADISNGETPPPGVSPDDTIVFTIQVTAVQK